MAMLWINLHQNVCHRHKRTLLIGNNEQWHIQDFIKGDAWLIYLMAISLKYNTLNKITQMRNCHLLHTKHAKPCKIFQF